MARRSQMGLFEAGDEEMRDMVALEELMGSVEEAMTTPVVTLTEATVASEAARILERAGASGAPVTTEDGGRVVGFVTMNDLKSKAGIDRAVQTGPFHRFEHLLAGVDVAEVMSRGVVVVHTHWPLMRAVEAMEQNAVHRLPVVDEDERLVGILTRDDVLRRLARAGARFPVAAGSRREPD